MIFEGTFNCPICSVGSPHRHTSAEIALNRAATRKSMAAARAERLAALIAERDKIDALLAQHGVGAS